MGNFSIVLLSSGKLCAHDDQRTPLTLSRSKWEETKTAAAHFQHGDIVISRALGVLLSLSSGGMSQTGLWTVVGGKWANERSQQLLLLLPLEAFTAPTYIVWAPKCIFVRANFSPIPSSKLHANNGISFWKHGVPLPRGLQRLENLCWGTLKLLWILLVVQHLTITYVGFSFHSYPPVHSLMSHMPDFTFYPIIHFCKTWIWIPRRHSWDIVFPRRGRQDVRPSVQLGLTLPKWPCMKVNEIGGNKSNMVIYLQVQPPQSCKCIH